MKDLYDTYGFIDESFNLGQNFGVAVGRVVLIDIGDLTDDKSQIRALIQSRAWASNFCTMHFTDELRPVFLKEMDGAFGSAES